MIQNGNLGGVLIENHITEQKTACFRLATRNFSKKLFECRALLNAGENLMKIHNTVTTVLKIGKKCMTYPFLRNLLKVPTK